MSINISLTDLTSLTNQTTAISQINNNSAAIETAFGSALNTAGDRLLGTMDANSNRIINLPSPGSGTEPVRLSDLAELATGSIVIGTTGYIPVFTTSTTLGNSVLEQISGNIVLASGDLSVGGTIAVNGGASISPYSWAALTAGGPLAVAVNWNGAFPAITSGQSSTGGWAVGSNGGATIAGEVDFINLFYGPPYTAFQWYCMGSATAVSTSPIMSLSGAGTLTTAGAVEAASTTGIYVGPYTALGLRSLAFVNNAGNGNTTAIAVNSSDDILYLYSRGNGLNIQSYGNAQLFRIDDAGNALFTGKVSSNNTSGNQPYVSLANYASLNAALAAISSTGGTIYVPPGTWAQGTTQAAVTCSYPIAIVGDPSVSILTWSGSNGGIAITVPTSDVQVSVRDLRLQTSNAGGGTALKIYYEAFVTDGQNGAQITNVNCGYTASGSGYYWNAGIEIINGRQCTLTDCSVQGFAHTSLSYASASTTSNTIASSGTKTWTVTNGTTQWYGGQSLTIYEHGSTANYMTGYVSTLTSTSLTLTVLASGGSGTFTAWDIDLYQPSLGYGDDLNEGVGVHLHGYTVATNINNLNCTDLYYGVWLTGTCEGVEIVAPQFIDCVFGLYAEGNDTSLQGTSTTSMTVGTGSQSFTTQTGLDYYANMPIQIYETANSANYMGGIVTSYNPSTGAMVVNVTSVGGSGTYSAWSIFPNHYISVINVSDGSVACLTCSLYFDWCAFVHVQDCEIQQRGLNYLYVDMQLISNNTVFFLHDNICTDYTIPLAPSGIIIQGVSTNSCINVHDNIFRDRANAIDFMSGANTNSYVHDNYGGAANGVTTTFQNGAGLSSTNYHNNI